MSWDTFATPRLQRAASVHNGAFLGLTWKSSMWLAELSSLRGQAESWAAAAISTWLLGSRSCAGCRASLEVEGGSAQEGDDITTQPLKDELFPQLLQLAPAPGRGGDIRPPDRTEGRTEVPVWPTPNKVGAEQGLVQLLNFCGEDRGSQHRGRVA